MNETKKGFIQLHLSVLLAGFTGLFGRLITLNEVDIVWYRILFTSCILLAFTGLPRVGWRKFLQLCGCGALLGLHWILFYGSIKASNVSIGVICFSLIGFFTALFEPMIFKKRFSGLEFLYSLITVAGVVCRGLSDTMSLTKHGAKLQNFWQSEAKKGVKILRHCAFWGRNVTGLTEDGIFTHLFRQGVNGLSPCFFLFCRFIVTS